jgi:hypothetical protein
MVEMNFIVSPNVPRFKLAAYLNETAAGLRLLMLFHIAIALLFVVRQRSRAKGVREIPGQYIRVISLDFI